MGKFDKYKIDLKGMQADSCKYEFLLDNLFFAHIDGPEVQKGKVNVELTVKKTSRAFELSFRTEGIVWVPCDRCLDEITEDFEVDIDEMIDMAIFETDKVDEIEELDYLEDHIINMDMLLQKELMTLVPMQILCKDDCKGLCKVCGANLNHETCDCDDFVPDPRLSVFANILKG